MASDTDRTTQFLELLTAHDRALSLHVYSLLPRDEDAEDVLQHTKMLMWKHFGDFEIGTNFLAWARKIAFHQILTHRRKKKREHLLLSDEALESLAEAVTDLAQEGSHRHEALRECINRLPEEHRQLVTLRYFEDLEIEQIAARIRRTEAAVYRALSRVRMALMDCVRKRTAVEAT